MFSQIKNVIMYDLIYIGIVLAFFVAGGFYARFCGKL